MNSFSQFFFSAEGIALILSAAIFLIALILVASRAISFWITLLLLLFSLAVGFIIANNSAFREYLKCRKEAKEDARFQNFSKQILEGFDQLKEEVDSLKESIKTPPALSDEESSQQ